jgi:hypothetical protein
MTRKINRVAVANFLASLTGLTLHEAFTNARMDARSYGWNDATLKAIIDGIARASKAGRL